MTTVDIAVVGAGPCGLFAAYYAGFRGLRVAVIDSLPEPGGQIAALYPDKLILDVAAHPAITGRELVDALLAQVAPFEPHFVLGDTASHVQRTNEGIAITTDTGEAITCRAVIIAGGVGRFRPRQLPAAQGWGGAGVDHVVRPIDDYRGKRVVVVGGGDSAVDWALTLAPTSRSVTLVHRSARFRAHAASVASLASSGVDVVVGAQVAQLEGEAALERVTLRNADRSWTLPCDALVAALGFVADLSAFDSWGLRRSDRHIEVDNRMRTSVAGVYAIGDISEYPGKIRLLAVGFGEAAIAVNHAVNEIDPALTISPGHSTDYPARTATTGVSA